jgi:2'-5' RNA ligase
VLEAVADWQRRTFGGLDVRVVVPENLHITLAFLHHRPASDLPAIEECLREAVARQRRRLELSLWRYRETDRVGMLQFDDKDGRASVVQGTLVHRLEERGLYEPERRKWRPHLTVIRFRRPPRLRPGLPDLGEVSPSEAAVYHSLLRRGGAQYEALETVRLGGG